MIRRTRTQPRPLNNFRSPVEETRGFPDIQGPWYHVCDPEFQVLKYLPGTLL